MYWENLIMQKGIYHCSSCLYFSSFLQDLCGFCVCADCSLCQQKDIYFGILTLLYCRTEERAAGWYRLTREILKLPEAPSVKDSSSDALLPKSSKDKSQKIRRPQPLIKLVMRRYVKSISLYFNGYLPRYLK